MKIIGLGTGRCGSMSLARLLNEQIGCSCTHEMTFDHTKYIARPLDINNKEMTNNYLNSLEARTLPIKADVSLWWLNSVEDIIEKFGKDVKFICLKRDKEQVQKSYESKFNNNGTPPGINPLQDHNGEVYRKDLWDCSYPKFEASNRLEAIGKYWDDYYKRSEEFSDKYPDQFKIINLEDLNVPFKVHNILKFCGFKDTKIVIKSENKGK